VRVIVGFDLPFQAEGALSAAGRQAQRQAIHSRANQVLAGLQGRNFRENRRYRSIPYLALTVGADALQHLANSPLVSSIAEDRRAQPSLASSNDLIGAPLAWVEGYDGSGQAVAVLDTGVDKAHPWFIAGGIKVVSEACYSTTSLVQNTTSLCPGGVASSTAAGSGLHCDPSITGCDHGTHVAGIVAGNDGSGPDFGAARGADLIAIQVFSQANSPADCAQQSSPCVTLFSADLIAALERVLELKDSFDIAAVNMSLGGDRYFDQASCDADNGATKAAIDNLRSFGIASVVASGNDGWKDSISQPACISSAVSVGATTDTDAIASFSSIYPQIDLLAPGVDVVSAVPGGGVVSYNGTSMATPLVAGAWAVLRQMNPAAGVDAILAALQSTGTPIDDLRIGGSVTDLPRINLDLALGDARTTFGIFNEGFIPLNVTSITPASPAPWISISPAAPFEVPARGLQVVEVIIDYDLAPPGESEVRLLVASNDPANNPWPGGVYIKVSTLEIILKNGFEAP
jgi:subtilisin family serine protease